MAAEYRGSTDYSRVLAELVHTAERRGLTTYQDIAIIMGIAVTGNAMGVATGGVIGEICEDEVEHGRPMLSAVVVGVSGRPGTGFYKLARQLNRIASGQSEDEFWESERELTYEAWRRPVKR